MYRTWRMRHIVGRHAPYSHKCAEKGILSAPTLDTYSHVLPGMDRGIGGALEEALG